MRPSPKSKSTAIAPRCGVGRVRLGHSIHPIKQIWARSKGSLVLVLFRSTRADGLYKVAHSQWFPLSAVYVHTDERHRTCLGVKARPRDAQRELSKGGVRLLQPLPPSEGARRAPGAAACLPRGHTHCNQHGAQTFIVSNRPGVLLIVSPVQCPEGESVRAFTEGMLSACCSSLMRHRRENEQTQPAEIGEHFTPFLHHFTSEPTMAWEGWFL